MIEKELNLSKENRMKSIPKGERHCKCSVTGYWGHTGIFFCPQKELGLNNEKNVYYKDMETWEKYEKWSQNRHEVLGFLARRIFEYPNGVYITTRTQKRLKILNEGDTGIKEYSIPFEVIKYFLESNERMIKDSLERIDKGSGFNSNNARESYAMAIIEDRLPLFYKSYVEQQKLRERREKEAKAMTDTIQMRQAVHKTKNDISHLIG